MWKIFDAILDKLIAKFSPTMWEYLDAILAILDKLISKFSPTLVEDFDAILDNLI